MKLAVFFLTAVIGFAQHGTQRRIGSIDFFGYKGLDMKSIREAVPLHVGDPFDPEHFDRDLFTDVMAKAAGHKLTDLNITCCDPGGNYLLYLGLGGASYRPVAFRPAPTGQAHLSSALKRAADAVDNAVGKAILSGHGEEDDSQGFALLKDPKARTKQLDFRKVVLREQDSILNVLATSADKDERAGAAEAMGYAERTDTQIAALAAAGLDSYGEVRNNATRALEVLVEGFPETAAKIPARPFLQLLSSGTWTDRNKSSILMERLTRSRDRQLLDQLRVEALDSLVEMARWHAPGHAWAARMILARMVGVDEQEIEKADTERIIGAATLGRKDQ